MTAALIEAAYRFDLSEREHLQELAVAATTAFVTKGQVAAITFQHKSIEETQAWVEVGRGDERIVRTITRAAAALTPSERQQTMTLAPTYQSCSALFGVSAAVAGFRHEGFGDVAGLMCLTDAQAGIVVCAAHEELKFVRPNERRYFYPAAVHVRSAWQLRHALTRGAAVADAVFRPDGRLVYADGALTARSARAQLRELVQRRERVRARARRDELPGFPALLAGTWTLADRFESDGRRYVVAYRVAPDAPDGVLSDAARSALAQAVAGTPNKVIALDLGVSEPTVTRLIARALETLRFTSLHEAMQLANSAPAWLVDSEPPLCIFRLADQTASDRSATLTPAERDVARRVVAGETRAMIARARGSTVSTVSSQLVSIYAKLRVGSRRGLLQHYADE